MLRHAVVNVVILTVMMSKQGFHVVTALTITFTLSLTVAARVDRAVLRLRATVQIHLIATRVAARVTTYRVRAHC